PHGPPALPLPLPVLRVGRRPAVVPALPAQRRRLPRRAVQPRVLLVAHRARRQGHRPRTGRVRPHVRRHAPLPQPPRPGSRTAVAGARAAPSPRARPRHHRPRHRRRRTDPGARLPPAAHHQRTHRGVSTAPAAPPPEVVLVAALDRTRVIGAAGGIPWHLPDDLRRFKALTSGHPVVMGRATFESIGRPLPGRTNVVLTRDPRWTADGVVTAG